MPDFGPRRNAEGYQDPTAFEGGRRAERPDRDSDQRANALIGAIKSLINLAGFDLLERIAVKDRRTGREFR